MPPDTTVPASPRLARLDRVELVKTGTWRLAVGGEQAFTSKDLAAAITALDCPAIGRPVIKLGHLDDRGDGLTRPGNRDGEPALGYVTNLGLTDDGQTLRGDFVGMPEWLGQIAASAYPSRSIEGARNFRCAIGHRHPFVISAVALLGVTPPAVGTLASLQDHVRALYGVAASSDPDPAGEPFTVTFTREDPVSEPQPFAAAVSVEDIRDAFYDGAPQNLWIVDIQVQPPQLIVTSSDDSDAMYRIPYVLNGDDDDESVTFGTPVPVEVQYVDTAPDPSEIGPVGVAASAAAVKPSRRAVFDRPRRYNDGGILPPGVTTVRNNTGRPIPVAAAEEPAPAEPPADGSEPVEPLATPQTPEPAPADPAAEPAAEPAPNTPEGGTDVPLSEFRSRLGLDDTADEAAVLAALDERLKPQQPDPQLVAAAAQRDEAMTTVAAMKGEVARLSSELATIRTREAAKEKETFFAAAINSGRLRPADLKTWQDRYDANRDMVVDIVNSMAPGSAVPVAAAGHSGSPDDNAEDAEYLALEAALYPPSARTATTAGKQG